MARSAARRWRLAAAAALVLVTAPPVWAGDESPTGATLGAQDP